MTLTAQQIVDAAVATRKGDELLIEVMARAMCAIYQPSFKPDDLYEFNPDIGPQPNWEFWKNEAKVHLALDRIIRKTEV